MFRSERERGEEARSITLTEVRKKHEGAILEKRIAILDLSYFEV